jgi:hypothetical protein
MTNILLKNLNAFFPYESIHAANPVISIEDKDKNWYLAIKSFLQDYEAVTYLNCTPGSFRVEMDNKITLRLYTGTSDSWFSTDKYIYLTYWDNFVYISNSYVTFSSIKLENKKYCIVKHK